MAGGRVEEPCQAESVNITVTVAKIEQPKNQVLLVVRLCIRAQGERSAWSGLACEFLCPTLSTLPLHHEPPPGPSYVLGR